jgi:hypothetical protein
MEFLEGKVEPPFDSAVHLLCIPSSCREDEGAINTLRSRLKEIDPHYDVVFCTDHQLMLFLQARNYNIEHALKMLLETFEWRKFRHPHTLGDEEGWYDFLENETKTGKIYNPGDARLCLPICSPSPPH